MYENLEFNKKILFLKSNHLLIIIQDEFIKMQDIIDGKHKLPANPVPDSKKNYKILNSISIFLIIY